MKRMFLALNPDHINRTVIDFGCYLGKLTGSAVTGVFIGNNISVPPISGPAEIMTPSACNDYVSSMENAQKAAVNTALSRFSEACICREAVYNLHSEHTITIEELIAESRFCDMLIVNPALSTDKAIEVSPSSQVRHLMLKAECPVILAPESFDTISEIVFTYDGSKASVTAIKQFTYLFPEFRNNKVFILEINAGKQKLADESILMEWVNDHYSHIEYVILKGDPVDEIITFLLPMNNAFVVMGAYGRSFFSRLIRSSIADPVSGTIINPIFIAH